MAIPEVLELPAVPPPNQEHPGRLYPKNQVQCFKPTEFSAHVFVSELGFFFFPLIEIIFCASFKALFGPPSSHKAEGDV